MILCSLTRTAEACCNKIKFRFDNGGRQNSRCLKLNWLRFLEFRFFFLRWVRTKPNTCYCVVILSMQIFIPGKNYIKCKKNISNRFIIHRDMERCYNNNTYDPHLAIS